jgi:hypothetical protein
LCGQPSGLRTTEHAGHAVGLDHERAQRALARRAEQVADLDPLTRAGAEVELVGTSDRTVAFESGLAAAPDRVAQRCHQRTAVVLGIDAGVGLTGVGIAAHPARIAAAAHDQQRGRDRAQRQAPPPNSSPAPEPDQHAQRQEQRSGAAAVRGLTAAAGLVAVRGVGRERQAGHDHAAASGRRRREGRRVGAGQRSTVGRRCDQRVESDQLAGRDRGRAEARQRAVVALDRTVGPRARGVVAVGPHGQQRGGVDAEREHRGPEILAQRGLGPGQGVRRVERRRGVRDLVARGQHHVVLGQRGRDQVERVAPEPGAVDLVEPPAAQRGVGQLVDPGLGRGHVGGAGGLVLGDEALEERPGLAEHTVADHRLDLVDVGLEEAADQRGEIDPGAVEVEQRRRQDRDLDPGSRSSCDRAGPSAARTPPPPPRA